MAIDYVTQPEGRIGGIDGSHWFGGILNWLKTKRLARFAIIKAIDGTRETPWWKGNAAAAKTAGVPRSFYAWLYPSEYISAGRQARALYALLTREQDFGDFPITVDLETTWWNGKRVYPNAKDLWGFVKVWEDLTGEKPMIYSSPSYWGSYGSTDPLWAEYYLWLANYQRGAWDLNWKPSIPAPWKNYTILQWTEKGFGEDYGLDKYQKRAVDLDVFYGDEPQFAAFLDQPVPEVPEVPKEEPMPVKYRWAATMVTISRIRIRPDHNVYTAETGWMYNVGRGNEIWVAEADGDRVKKGDRWLKLEAVDGVEGAVVGWVALTHLGTKFCTLADMDPESPSETLSIPFDLNIAGYKPYHGELEKE